MGNHQKQVRRHDEFYSDKQLLKESVSYQILQARKLNIPFIPVIHNVQAELPQEIPVERVALTALLEIEGTFAGAGALAGWTPLDGTKSRTPLLRLELESRGPSRTPL